MEKNIVAEGEKDKDLFDKYMCYCKTSGGDLGKSISDAETKIPELDSDISSAEAQKTQLDEDVKQAQEDRAAAKEAMAQATALREKEAAAYAKSSSDLNANLNACAKATVAIEKGMAGSFLQTPWAGILRKVAEQRQEQELLSFLEGSEQYAPQSGQIVGILKTMHDEMSVELADETEAENNAIKSYDALMASKLRRSMRSLRRLRQR
jgi:outer membrane murein-binding lipoprotein Lpp